MITLQKLVINSTVESCDVTISLNETQQYKQEKSVVLIEYSFGNKNFARK